MVNIEHYGISENIDSVELDFSKSLIALKLIRERTKELETINNSIRKLDFSHVNNIYSGRIKEIATRLKYALTLEGAFQPAEQNIKNTINQLYAMNTGIDNFEFNYADFYVENIDIINSYNNSDIDLQYEALGYQDALRNLNQISNNYTENSDGSITYKCNNDGTITIKNGKIIMVSSPQRPLYSLNGDIITNTYSSAITYFDKGKPYATYYKSINAYVNFSNLNNIIYNWVSENDYEIMPVFMNGTTSTELKNSQNEYIDYTGEYLLFKIDDIQIVAPLAIYDYKDGNLITTPLDGIDRIKYINTMITYVNDVQKKFNELPNNFQNTINNCTDSISLLYVNNPKVDTYYGSYREDVFPSGFCRQKSNMSAGIVVYVNSMFDDNTFNVENYVYNYKLGTMIHEMGHAYANAARPPLDNNETWLVIYNQVKEIEEIAGKDMSLRAYSISSNKELFADIIKYYCEEPERLKVISIDISITTSDGTTVTFNNLYDYTDYVLKYGI